MTDDHHVLWYPAPAADTDEALPIGNGRTGALCHGQPGAHLLALNDSTAWSGSPWAEEIGPPISAARAADAVRNARSSILDGDHSGATPWLQRLQHRHSQTYLPLAGLVVGLHPTTPGTSDGYLRRLDLRTAEHTVRYRIGSCDVLETTFVSGPHGVLVHRVEVSEPVGITLALESPLRIVERSAEPPALLLRLPSDVFPAHDQAEDPVRYDERPGAALDAAVVLGVEHDGVRQPVGSEAWAGTGVRHATVYLATATTFTGLGRAPLGTVRTAYAAGADRVARALAAGYPTVNAAHRADHASLYARTELRTGPAGPDGVRPGPGTAPTDGMLLAANADPRGPLAHRPELAGLLFNYGRYLLISSSRPGSPPANLQGIWNTELRPPWSSNYTINVNTQMNYWAAEVAHLRECAEPVLDLVDALARTGRRAAAVLYGAQGWAAHHNTDAWAYPWPVGHGTHNPSWAFAPLSGAWLARQYTDRIDFGTDEALYTRAWPAVRGAAGFVLDLLVPDGDDLLGTIPSTSAENEFRTADGRVAAAARSAAFDLTVATDTLTTLVRLADLLGRSTDPVVRAAAAALPRIRRPRISDDGRIGEWRDDLTETDPHHRHLSHLAFLYPSGWPVDDDLAAAVSRTLDVRGDESTGWSLAWKLALRARLRQPAAVDRLLALYFRDTSTARGPMSGGLYPNLLAAHPPFQIDGNFGLVAGLAECLLQSHHGQVELLPALPETLARGAVRGLVARPGIEVDIDWAPDLDGRPALSSATLRRLPDRSMAGPVRVRYRAATVVVDVGDARTLGPDDFAVRGPAPEASPG